MSSPRSIRFEGATLARLDAYARARPGLTASAAAARLVEEGLRMAEHPGVVFRGGPAGRRAVVISGPDVWEVVRAVRDTRAAEPDLSTDDLLALVAQNSGTAPAHLRVALAYYGAHPSEIEPVLLGADVAQAQAEDSYQATRRLLGA